MRINSFLPERFLGGSHVHKPLYADAADLTDFADVYLLKIFW
jgi:hypothetical protein